MLMAHTMQVQSSDTVSRIYDLKGSSVDRKVKVRSKSSKQITLKDENFVQLSQSLALPFTDKERVLK